MRFLGYTLGDPTSPLPQPDPELFEQMGKFVEEATNAGVLVATGGVVEPAKTVKVVYAGGDFTVLDGPFTESKELIGGWALMECRDLEEAIEWSKRFVSVVGEGEVRVRPAEAVWIDGEYGPE